MHTFFAPLLRLSPLACALLLLVLPAALCLAQPLEGEGEGLTEGEGSSEGEGVREGEGEGAAPLVFFVDRDRFSAVRDGSTWEQAFRTLQPAIDAAWNAGGGEVWVAEGRYNEARPNSGSLLLRPGVVVYGGFAGDETARGQRDWVQNRTTIDGFEAAGGAPAATVIRGADDAVLSGFIVRGGRGLRGGGMLNDGVSPTVEFCVFTDNRALELGGAMYNTAGAAPEILNSIFFANRAEIHGGAIANDVASPRLIGCTLSENVAAFRGGGLYNLTDSDPVLINCIVWNNPPEEIGNTGDSRPDVSYTVISEVTPGVGNIFTGPAFRNPGIGNFTLLPGSVAIDTGRDTSAAAFANVTRDYEGVLRGFDGDQSGRVTGDGSDYDIGAEEFVGEDGFRFHSADTESDFDISLSELLRVVQFFNVGGYSCLAGTEDGYAPGKPLMEGKGEGAPEGEGEGGAGPCADGVPHDSDYQPQDFCISLSELLRLVQFFNSPGGYRGQEGTEDGFEPLG